MEYVGLAKVLLVAETAWQRLGPEQQQTQGRQLCILPSMKTDVPA